MITKIIFALLLVTQFYPAISHAQTDAQIFNKEIAMRNPAAGAINPVLADSKNPHVEPFAATIDAAQWKTSSIPVCWENPTAENEAGRIATQDAVSRTWEAVSKISFTGWQTCAAENAGIRVRIADEGPRVETIGRFLDRMHSGMVLNFTFNNWGQNCQSTKDSCIRSIAVHEFGHALSFTHEQNRPDTPGECQKAQGPNPDKLLTPYDPSSVMNYCNKKWNNDGFLSQKDVGAVQLLYGAR